MATVDDFSRPELFTAEVYRRLLIRDAGSRETFIRLEMKKEFGKRKSVKHCKEKNIWPGERLAMV